MKRFLYINEHVFNNRNHVKAHAMIIEKTPDLYEEKSVVVKEFDVLIQIPSLKDYELKKNKTQQRKKDTSNQFD